MILYSKEPCHMIVMNMFFESVNNLQSVGMSTKFILYLANVRSVYRKAIKNLIFHICSKQKLSNC